MIDQLDIELIKPHLITIGLALGFLVAGWLIAAIASTVIAAVIGKLPVNKWLEESLGKSSNAIIPIEIKLKSVIYYLIMIFVLVGFFQKLGLTMISDPLNVLLVRIFEFLPQVAAGVGLLVVAWIIASILKAILSKALNATQIDEKLSKELGRDEEQPVGTMLSEAVYWLTFLFFLPAVLDAFSLQGMLVPVNEMVTEVTGYLPNILSAAIVFGIGWLVARIVQRLSSALLASFGADAVGKNLGIEKALGSKKLSDVVGYLVYVFILIPVIIQALDALAIEAVSKPAIHMLDIVMLSFPKVLAGVLILTMGYMLAKVISNLVTNLLTTVGFNRVLNLVGFTCDTKNEETTPAAIVGKITMIAVIYLALIEAFQVIGFAALTGLLEQFLVVAGQILMGILILGIGLMIANFAHKLITDSGTANAGVLAPAAKTAVVILSTAMALRQMGLANEIINMAFGILLGAIGVAIAIAFGFGGRDIAATQLEEWKKQLKA